jgi:hypothetical protein
MHPPPDEPVEYFSESLGYYWEVKEVLPDGQKRELRSGRAPDIMAAQDEADEAVISLTS